MNSRIRLWLINSYWWTFRIRPRLVQRSWSGCRWCTRSAARRTMPWWHSTQVDDVYHCTTQGEYTKHVLHSYINFFIHIRKVLRAALIERLCLFNIWNGPCINVFCFSNYGYGCPGQSWTSPFGNHWTIGPSNQIFPHGSQVTKQEDGFIQQQN